jgi:hypothetical protein
MLQQVRLRGQEAHTETAGVVETELELAAELEDEMIVWGIVLYRGAYPEATGHAKVQEQHVRWMQVDEEIFGASINTLNRAANGVLLQRLRVDEMAEAGLPHPHAGDLATNDACSQTTSDSFHFW